MLAQETWLEQDKARKVGISLACSYDARWQHPIMELHLSTITFDVPLVRSLWFRWYMGDKGVLSQKPSAP